MGKATISGTLLAASDAPAGRSGAAAGEPLANATVRVASTGQAAQTDSAGRFTLTDVAPGIVNLEIRGAGVSSTATVSAAPGALTKVTVTVTRGRSTVTLDPRGHGVEGTVDSVNAPNFVVKNSRGKFTIMTDGNTIFRMQDAPASFGDLKMGQRVEVEGSPQANGSILAAQVEIENPENEQEATKTPTPTVTGTPPTAAPTRTPEPEDEERTKTPTPTVTGTPPTAAPTRTPEPEETRSPTVTGTRTPRPGDDGDDQTKLPTVTGTRTPRPDDDGENGTRTPEH